MNTPTRFMALVVGLVVCQVGLAQAPAGSTGLCKDGTYSTAASKSGACAGHKGVKEWYASSTTETKAAKETKAPKETKASKAAAATAPAPATTMAPAAAAPAASSAARPAAAAPATPAHPAKTKADTAVTAPGGGNGLVWLNADSNVYHCEGSHYYGKTKAGAYMSEADAKAKGGRPNQGKPCK